MEKQTPARAEREVGALELVGELRVGDELERESFEVTYTDAPLFRREERVVGVVYFLRRPPPEAVEALAGGGVGFWFVYRAGAEPARRMN